MTARAPVPDRPGQLTRCGTNIVTPTKCSLSHFKLFLESITQSRHEPPQHSIGFFFSSPGSPRGYGIGRTRPSPALINHLQRKPSKFPVFQVYQSFPPNCRTSDVSSQKLDREPPRLFASARPDSSKPAPTLTFFLSRRPHPSPPPACDRRSSPCFFCNHCASAVNPCSTSNRSSQRAEFISTAAIDHLKPLFC